jgi:hypothetical protein
MENTTTNRYEAGKKLIEEEGAISSGPFLFFNLRLRPACIQARASHAF